MFTFILVLAGVVAAIYVYRAVYLPKGERMPLLVLVAGAVALLAIRFLAFFIPFISDLALPVILGFLIACAVIHAVSRK